LGQTSSTNVTTSREISAISDFQELKLKLEGELSSKIIIIEDKREIALINEALWRNSDEEFEMFVLELQKVGREVEKLVFEQRNICF
jgi:hypothetical protein